jgi:hypothetical protein
MPTATSLMKAIEKLLNIGDIKTSPISYDAINLDNKVSMNVLSKDDNGILKNFHITIETTKPPSDPELYNKKSDTYKTLFD